MAVLEEEGQGLGVLPDVVVPIVSAAVLFDLALGSSSVRPSAEWGTRAASEASSDPVQSGNIGAGTGATVGKLAGPAFATKGGLGSASLTLPNGVKVAALVAVNAVGEIVDSATGAVIAGVRGPEKGAYRSSVDIDMGLYDEEGPIGSNTTIGIVVTDAPLSKADLKKVAEMAHDGFARAIRPVHTQFDGDTLFAVSTSTYDEHVGTTSHSGASLNSIGVAAAKVVEMAIIDGVTAAESLLGCVASRDW
jgi:L-aminopeptidase/D-esterase-like protein